MENIITMQERESILNNMIRLLDEYDYDYTEKALYKIIDTWAENKANLISILKKHPNYVDGKFMIAFNTDWNREINSNGAYVFANWIMRNLDEIAKIMPEEAKEQVEKENKNLYYGDAPYIIPRRVERIFYNYDRIACQFVSEARADELNIIHPSLRFQEGMKMSRAVNKICHWMNIDKLPDYNKEFAKYADSVNPLKIVRHTILSLNPIDYLTMSFGNSWASCHTIDKRNRRGMPNSYEGQYSSGTISYMLDKVSMVFYTVGAEYNGDEYYFESKINRCMFHYGKDKLIQGRVYPQDNDCNSDNIYKDIREIVQRIMSDCLEMPNYWATKRGPNEIGDYVFQAGTNYPDYRYYDNCCISFPKEKEINNNAITIGHYPICIECGREHEESDNINHCKAHTHVCYNCGCVVDEDDGYFVDDEWFCNECAHRCPHCGYAYPESEMTYIDQTGEWVCDDCRSEYYTQCEECDEWVRDYDTTYIDHYRISVCDCCLENFFTECTICEEYYRNDDMHYDEAEDNSYCEDCWEEVNENEEEAE